MRLQNGNFVVASRASGLRWRSIAENACLSRASSSASLTDEFRSEWRLPPRRRDHPGHRRRPRSRQNAAQALC